MLRLILQVSTRVCPAADRAHEAVSGTGSMAERGVTVGHATLNRWVEKYVGAIADEAQRRKGPASRSWRMDETCHHITRGSTALTGLIKVVRHDALVV